MSTRWRGRPDWETDLAVREARTPAEAQDRARKGRALVDAALAGVGPDDVAAPAATMPQPTGYEYVACDGCYRPVWGRPGDRCPDCRPPTVDPPPDPPAP